MSDAIPIELVAAPAEPAVAPESELAPATADLAPAPGSEPATATATAAPEPPFAAPIGSSRRLVWRRRFDFALELFGELVGRLAASARANRGVALTLSGLALAIFSIYVQPDGALTLPLLVLSALIVIRGVFGQRVSGNLNLSWGEDGTQLRFETRVAPPPTRSIEGRGETIEFEVARLDEMIDRPSSPIASRRGDLGSHPASLRS